MGRVVKYIILTITSAIIFMNVYNAYEIEQDSGYKQVSNIPYSGYEYAYTKCNGSKLKAKEVVYNEETKTFKVKGITEVSRCNFYFNKDGNEIITRNTINVVVLNGTVDISSKIIKSNESTNFTLTPAGGYGNPSVNCTNGQTGTLTENTLSMSNITNDTTCTVTYQEKEYTIKYNSSGGTGTMADSTYSYNESKDLRKNTYTKDGYAFVGWSTNPNATEAEYRDEEEVSKLTTENEIILYAVWKKQHTLTLDKNGAESISKTTLDCVVSNTDSCTIILPDITAKDGFEVVGWSTDPNATTAEANAGDTVTINNNTTYYAITKSSVALSATFKPNGATIDNVTTDITKSCYRYNGASTCNITAPTITRPDWTIIGFGTESSSTSATNQSGSTISLSSNVTRYAVTSKEVNITYYTKEGDLIGSFGDTVFNTESSNLFYIDDSLSQYNREGYDFLGWSTNPNATEATYIAGNSYNFSESIALYPVFQLKTYEVKVTALKGTITGVTSKTVNHGSNATFTVNASTGYGYPEITCTNNQNASYSGTTLTVENVTNNTTCTVEYFDLAESCFAFNKEEGKITTYYDYQGGGTSGTACPRSVVIPSKLKNTDVTTLGINSFREKNITAVTIPDTVTTIENNVFYRDYLTTVTIPNGVKKINGSTFEQNKLTSVTLGTGLEDIDDYAFKGNQLTALTIPDSVTRIGSWVFKDNSLKSVKLSNNLKEIGTDAFMLNSLTSVTIPNSVETIGNSAFYQNSISTLTLGSGVKTIGTSAFNQNSLTKVVIPNSVETIGEAAFRLNQLTTVTLGTGLQTISGYAFYDNKITSVVIPNNVTTIGENAFAYNSLTTATIGTGVTSIGNQAFYVKDWGNENLTKIINKTGRSFNWGLIVNNASGSNFVTGTLTTSTNKTLTVSAS